MNIDSIHISERHDAVCFVRDLVNKISEESKDYLNSYFSAIPHDTIERIVLDTLKKYQEG